MGLLADAPPGLRLLILQDSFRCFTDGSNLPIEKGKRLDASGLWDGCLLFGVAGEKR